LNTNLLPNYSLNEIIRLADLGYLIFLLRSKILPVRVRITLFFISGKSFLKDGNNNEIFIL